MTKTHQCDWIQFYALWPDVITNTCDFLKTVFLSRTAHPWGFKIRSKLGAKTFDFPRIIYAFIIIFCPWNLLVIIFCLKFGDIFVNLRHFLDLSHGSFVIYSYRIGCDDGRKVIEFVLGDQSNMKRWLEKSRHLVLHTIKTDSLNTMQHFMFMALKTSILFWIESSMELSILKTSIFKKASQKFIW